MNIIMIIIVIIGMGIIIGGSGDMDHIVVDGVGIGRVVRSVWCLAVVSVMLRLFLFNARIGDIM